MKPEEVAEIHRNFYLDPTSPSGIRWKREIRSGADQRILVFKAGDVAGGKRIIRKGEVKGWVVGIFRVPRFVHRVIMVLLGNRLTAKILVDHKDGNPLNNKLDNLRLVDHTLNARNASMSSRNTTGVKGVSRTWTKNRSGNVYWFYEANVIDLDKKMLRKKFSISKLGEKAAFEGAKQWRREMIAELNTLGAGYTDRHSLETT